ncbi:lipopolysaccharide biosynthesis protein [Ureibacillus endophyticus]|uniref:Sugar translocase n=1 Tax=Ureibacillus endophyticus TaxID=1978490 RepID=A0A494YZ23_9BACL|nr:polysaccharide biosynthesis C-terminal domain-containing protein [Lysinibacillus endophyticus]RKQ15446.1 sugar translocase [Lysinibacillus endophyticus]
MRIKSSLKNLLVAFLGQLIGILISFIARIVFIGELGVDYLSLNALFANIISLLSLVELGIGPAMIFSLYKPLANNNIEDVKSLMKLYQKVYIIIGILIIVLGTIFTPFISLFIKTMPDIPSVHLIFSLFVANTAISYFYSYKRSLIIADQKRYIATFYSYSFFAILNIIQIFILLLTHNFILFLTCQLIVTFMENIIVSKTANRLYPYLKDVSVRKLSKEVMNEISRNVRAMVAHRLGGVVVNSTSNIVISKFIGLNLVGLYSNYQLIINALNTVLGQVFLSITASVGNLGATEKDDKKIYIFNIVLFMNFWIYGFSAICLVILFNSFIQLWIGNEYILNKFTVLLIILNFYLSGMRMSVLTFKDAFGLYYYDRHKPIFEAIINLAFSLILVKSFGINGVLLATTISTLTTCFWVEPFVLYKHGFKSSAIPFFRKYLLYGIVTFVTCIITYYIANIFSDSSIVNFILQLVICITIPNFIFLILFNKTMEFKYINELLKGLIRNRIKLVS